MRFAGRLGLLLLLVASVASAAAATLQPTDPVVLPAGDRVALDAAVHALCGRKIALLGEGAGHGDGHAVAFKVALVRRLVTDCHYDAIVFESSLYEFVALNRGLRQGTATPDMVADAVGGVWKFDREFQPLVGFLFAQAVAGRVRLAGLDAQLGGLGETYANERMIPELTGGMDDGEARGCTAAFAARAAWSYPADHPYGPAEHERLLGCARAMRRTLDAGAGGDPLARTERRAMIDNIAWSIGSDLAPRTDQVAAREQWLYRNYAAFGDSLPRRSRIIVWGATVHLAKSVAAIPAFAGYGRLGASIHRGHGTGAYTLGFAAGGGTYRVSRTLLPIDPPPADSLEAQTLAEVPDTAVFLDHSRIRRLGTVAAAVLDHVSRSADWAQVVDGTVVFREEWGTHNTRPGY